MNRIEARVCAVNAAGMLANEWHPKLVEVMRQFVGKKVVTQQNELTAQVKKAIAPVLGDGRGIHLSSYKDYSLTWIVKTCVSSDGNTDDYQIANYHEISMCVGRISDHVLTEVCEMKGQHKTDYTVEEIVNAREAYRQAKEVADELYGKLYPFGEYDR
jgi:hypothetical protein